MRTANIYSEDFRGNPLDVIEDIVCTNEWSHDRRSDSEMAVEIPGHWSTYNLYFAWSEDMGAIHLSCAFDMRIPSGKSADLYELLAQLNERMWLGHFTIWSDENLPMFRHSMLMQGGEKLVDDMERLVDIAVSECERFFPAFQLVIWGGKSADEAVAGAMLDTVGEA